VVDESNLQRHIIYGQSDIGRSKAQSARDTVAEINPLTNVIVHEEQLSSENAMRIFEPYDFIVDGTDNFATRYLVNDACVLLGKIYQTRPRTTTRGSVLARTARIDRIGRKAPVWRGTRLFAERRAAAGPGG
jgi:molybdopterin/thiamine biosynthesis adenylyltransferase